MFGLLIPMTSVIVYILIFLCTGSAEAEVLRRHIGTLPIAPRQATTIVNNTWIVSEQVLYLFGEVASVFF